MRLNSFRVLNFKSIIDSGECKLSNIDNVLILAGQNESGKSSVLEALDFFGNGESEKFIKFQRRQGTDRTEVKCTFLINDSDKTQLIESFQGLPQICDAIQATEVVTVSRIYKENSDYGFSVHDNFFSIFPEENLQNPNPDEKETSELLEYKAKLTELLLKLIPTFSLYNSFNDLLPSEITLQELPNSKAIKDFEKVFGVDLKGPLAINDFRERTIAKNKIEKIANDDFNESWSQSLKSLKGNYKYQFSVNFESAEQKIIFMISGEDNLPLYLEQKSLGFRWFSAFHLRLKALRKESKENSNKGIVILIDEPGQNLHDIAQRDAKKIINETAVDNTQIIYSTHNPNLIGDINTNEIEFTRIRIVSNDAEKGTSVQTISQYMSQTKKGSLDALSPIRTAMGLNSSGSLFNAKAHNTIVEGISDHYYLTALREYFKYNSTISFIPVCGVDNVKSLVGILIGWGMNYKAVFDDDANQGRKVYNEMKKHFFEQNDDLAHEHILKLKGMNGIEDIFSKNDFRKYIYKNAIQKKEESLSNSAIAKFTSKELLGRNFLELIRSDSSNISFEKETKDNVDNIFSWLNQKFGINS
ncbi:MAG: ATP-dependent nuclease [Ginsengibacter sp.]